MGVLLAPAPGLGAAPLLGNDPKPFCAPAGAVCGMLTGPVEGTMPGFAAG